MNSFHHFALITCAALFVAPAFAQTNPNDPRGPMRYTRIQDVPASDDSSIKLRTIKHENEKESPPATESSQTRIWNKYKALATGQTEEEREAAAKKAAEEDAAEASLKKEKETKAQEEEKAQKAEKEPEKPSGIAALLDEYKKNKAMRSQMRTINVAKPEDGAGETDKMNN